MNDETVEIKISEHDKRLDVHGERLDRIEIALAESKTDIKNLCKDIRNLTGILKWLCTLMGGSLVTFFFYAIQHQIFK
ncbi:hemolysin XhlA family protein [Haloimpatiens sp. FM7315]|uniref:hemolysin XhlA family protein n=1 Tax=Haloimpatiens sp. FM7315 TaxID=3298609 RepID=UPI0035A381D5